MKLLLPAALGIGTIARIAAATGSMRDAGIVLFAKFCPVSGSRIADVKTPLSLIGGRAPCRFAARRA